MAVKQVLFSQESGTDLDINGVAKLVYESLLVIDSYSIVSSIGSQGFLSIPLYRLDKGCHSFDFMRLHIWENSFVQLINQQAVDNFSIHSHQFHANSWILAGEVYNTRVDIEETSEQTGSSLFEIKWNNTGNYINQKTSVALNTGRYVVVSKHDIEAYKPGSTYEIEAGKYHISKASSNCPMSATLFLFSTNKSRVPTSYVVGPSHIYESEINRKIKIDPIQLLLQLNETIC